MQEVNLLTAFGAGILTFFAPCTFVTLPSFVSYLFMQATGKETLESGAGYRARVLLSALSYITGFLLVFVLLGMTATGIGSVLRIYSDAFQTIGAILIILFGLFILLGDRFKKLQFLYRERKVELKPDQAGKGYLYPFIIGLTSAFAWTPCIGPILGSILLLASTTSESVFQGGFLLFIYGLGITVPFMILAFFLGSAQGLMKKFNKYTPLIHRISALLLILVGLMLLTGYTDQLYGSVYRLFSGLGFQAQ